jgi:TolB-like protein/DNA-binding winged helix-turn-helix (wHTH) protein
MARFDGSVRFFAASRMSEEAATPPGHTEATARPTDSPGQPGGMPGRSAEREANLHFGEYELDLGRQELRRNGEAVAIEPQVFDVLVHLVRNRERVVGKDELFETIWLGRIVSEAALSSRISAARRAIGDNGDQQAFIRTVYKRGFRFVGAVEAAASSDESSAVVSEVATGAAAGSASRLQAEIPATVDPEPAASAGRPAIAVLPFTNLTREADSPSFGQGLMEDLIRLLARNRWLTVVSRHSSSAFTDPAQGFAAIGEALNVRYLLTGSVRRSQDALRLRVELVRAADGTQLWAEVYEVPPADIFEIELEMARQIAATIEPELSRLEQQRAARKPPRDLDAWDCYQRGLWHLWTFTAADFDKAEGFFRRAIEIDASFARAYAHLGYLDVQRTFLDRPCDRAARLVRALTSARTAIALDDRDCLGYCVVGRALSLQRRNDEAELALSTALELNPSFAQAYFAQGFNSLWAGRALEADALLERATMLSPRDAHLWSFHHVRAWARFSLGEMEAAARYALRAAQQPNATYRAFATLAASWGQLGHAQEAAAAAAELRRRKPDYSAARLHEELFFCADQSFIARYVAGLQAAGMAAAS